MLKAAGAFRQRAFAAGTQPMHHLKGGLQLPRASKCSQRHAHVCACARQPRPLAAVLTEAPPVAEAIPILPSLSSPALPDYSAPEPSPLRFSTPGVAGPWVSRSHDFDQSLPTGLAVTWLGTSSGRPTLNRNVSCTLVRMTESVLVVDCGEGSVRQLMSTGLDLNQIERIFITHLHGDHVFGLPGLIRHLSAINRDKPPHERHVYVYGPPGLVEFVRTNFCMQREPLNLLLTVTEFVSSKQARLDPCPLQGVPNAFQCQQGPDVAPHVPQLKTMEQVAGPKYTALLAMMRKRKRLNPRAFDKVNMQPQGDQAWYVRCGNGALVGAAQLLHRVPCWGYAMYEPSPGHQLRPRKVVVLGDTMNSSAVAPLAWGADMLAHEATFAQGMEHKAYEALHSTAWMAGLFAKSVRAKQLVLTHFSSRYDVTDGAHDNPMPGRREQPGGSDDEDMGANVQSDEIEQLLEEAKDAFGSSDVSAASDFFTFHVPPAAQEPPAA